MEGIQVKRIASDAFREFARRHGVSSEVGRIGTYFDEPAKQVAAGEPHLFGLFGCGTLCAIACCTVKMMGTNDTQSCKLDSIIVDAALRRRGLAGFLVCGVFRDLVTDPHLRISILHSHAVHPATVRLLRGLSFSGPPPTGAPLCSIKLEEVGRQTFVALCDDAYRRHLSPLKLQCAFCRGRDRRARPWCQSREH